MPHAAKKVAVVLGMLVVTAGASTRVDASDGCAPLRVTEGAAGTNNQLAGPGFAAVASLNIAGDPRTKETLEAWAQQRSFDVLLLQEVGNGSVDGASFVAALSERLGYNFAYAPADRFGATHTQGLAIVSRFPLEDVRAYPLPYHHLRFKSRCRIALAARVLTPDGPVRLMNVHLDTRINSQERIAQIAPLLDALNDGDGPQIIGGDFNTMNIWWFRTMWPFLYLQRQAAAVRARLAGHGFHTPFTSGPPTFRFLGLPFRLDWLFLKGLEAVDWNVDPVRFTDHRGVWVRLRPHVGRFGA